MKKILFIVPDSTGIRNYLYSDILTYLKYKSIIHIWSPLNEESFNDVINSHKIKIKFTKINFLRENYIGMWLRETVTYSRLKHNSFLVKNNTILTNWKYNPKGVFKKLFSYTNILFGSVLAWNYRLLIRVETLSRKLWSEKKIKVYEFLLQENQIEVLFITHQRVVGVMPICLAAKKLGIPVITVIYSWDNLPKARLNVMADTYIVWAHYMKEEMALYYPEIGKEKILVCGTPQFEFYLKEHLVLNRENFAKKYGLDPSKNWILYSGGDTTTSPFDPIYLNHLLLSVENETNIQVIFRRSPADFTNRFNEVINNQSYKIYVIDPIWINNNNWANNIPMLDDFNLLINLAVHCELAINVGSTIAHDFANFNKPTIYVNYDLNNNKKWSVKIVNNFQHFRSMPTKNSVVWINHIDEWHDKILETIRYPNEVAIDRIIWYKKINLVEKISASEKIANLLLQ